MPVHLRYRADIDGLRAIAVLPVVLFHFGFSTFTGGFVGVDIFFVISGFLIASLIVTEIDEGRFSIVNFYERRIRRIFPALFLVFIVTSVASAFVLLPDDLQRYAKSIVAADGFFSNFKFYHEAGYFDVDAHRKPLLHTWSLAVEEQFYLVFPPLLLLAARYLKRRFLLVVAPIFVLSLAFSIWAVYGAPEAAFYLLPSRMWEIMLGAWLALTGRGESNRLIPRRIYGMLSLLGLGMITYSVFAFSADTPFPGSMALLPCGGAALIILGGRDGTSIVNKLLSTGPLVFVGKISYSLYLWHWPLIVLVAYPFAEELPLLERWVLLAIAFALSILSWRYVEQPFRVRPPLLNRGPLLWTAAVVMGGTAALGMVTVYAKGFPQRLDPAQLQILAATHDWAPYKDRCRDLTLEQIARGELCPIGSKTARAPEFVLWGDSHASAWAPAISDAAAAQGKAGFLATHASCVPMLDVESYAAGHAFGCQAFNDAVYHYLATSGIHEVILSGRWGRAAEGTPYRHEAGTNVVLDDGLPREGDGGNRAVFARSLERTVARLRQDGFRVVVIGPVPEIGLEVPETIVKRELQGLSADFGPTLSEFETRQAVVLTTLTGLQKKYGIDIIYPHQALCDSKECAVMRDGYPLYRDSHHLSMTGARSISNIFAHAF